MEDKFMEEQVTAELVNEEQVDAKTLSTQSSKTWSDRSSDSGSAQSGSRLSPVSRDASGVDFDVVAVHGIRDNYKTAWRRKYGSRWISDTLFKEKSVREVDYGYDIDEDARLFESGGLESHAEDLITRFSQFRHPSGAAADRHPIIWICHDLGGTMVKEALRLALINPRKYGDIAMLTTAIVFLGTPHRFQSVQDAEDQLHDLLLFPD
ncbi:hypothetical protein Trisim1_006133 [Trichoderma cf. simile WF8]